MRDVCMRAGIHASFHKKSQRWNLNPQNVSFPVAVIQTNVCVHLLSLVLLTHICGMDVDLQANRRSLRLTTYLRWRR